MREDPEDARYHEMRAAVRVDDKKFAPALEDYWKALDGTPGDCPHLHHGLQTACSPPYVLVCSVHACLALTWGLLVQMVRLWTEHGCWLAELWHMKVWAAGRLPWMIMRKP